MCSFAAMFCNIDDCNPMSGCGLSGVKTSGLQLHVLGRGSSPRTGSQKKLVEHHDDKLEVTLKYYYVHLSKPSLLYPRRLSRRRTPVGDAHHHRHHALLDLRQVTIIDLYTAIIFNFLATAFSMSYICHKNKTSTYRVQISFSHPYGSITTTRATLLAAAHHVISYSNALA